MKGKMSLKVIFLIIMIYEKLGKEGEARITVSVAKFSVVSGGNAIDVRIKPE